MGSDYNNIHTLVPVSSTGDNDTGGCIKTQTTRSCTQCDGIYSILIVKLPCFETMNNIHQQKILYIFFFNFIKSNDQNSNLKMCNGQKIQIYNGQIL